MHRNTFLLLTSLAVFAALLVGIRVGRALPKTSDAGGAWQSAQTHTPTIPPNLDSQTLTYTNTQCGITLAYPSHLTKLEATAGAMFLDNTVASASVAFACQNGIPRPPLVSDRIETVVLRATNGATFSARLYHNTSAKDGEPVDELIFTHPKTGLDVFLSGFGPIFDAILSSLKIL